MPDDLLPYSGKPCLQDPNTSVRFHDDSVAPLFPTVDCMLCPLEVRNNDKSFFVLPQIFFYSGNICNLSSANKDSHLVNKTLQKEVILS